MAECGLAVRDGGQRLADLSRFPSFGAKIPQKDLLHWPKAFALGGWLGGALQWHLTFMWIYIATGLVYLGYQIFSGNYRQVLFTPRDIPGVWPMVQHYFFFGPKPVAREVYNPLQKLAYTSVDRPGRALGVDRTRGLEAGAVFLAGLDDGRLSLGAVLAFCGDVGDSGFVFGHLVMVVLHGWNNFVSMLTGWKKDPEYTLSSERAAAAVIRA